LKYLYVAEVMWPRNSANEFYLCPWATYFDFTSGITSSGHATDTMYFDDATRDPLLERIKTSSCRNYTSSKWQLIIRHLLRGDLMRAHKNWGNPSVNLLGYLKVHSVVFKTINEMTLADIEQEGLSGVQTLADFKATKYAKDVAHDIVVSTRQEYNRHSKLWVWKTRRIGFVYFTFVGLQE
jgi:hypothetical protein